MQVFFFTHICDKFIRPLNLLSCWAVYCDLCEHILSETHACVCQWDLCSFSYGYYKLSVTYSGMVISNSKVFIQENALETVVCEMKTIFSWPQCVNRYSIYVKQISYMKVWIYLWDPCIKQLSETLLRLISLCTFDITSIGKSFRELLRACKCLGDANSTPIVSNSVSVFTFLQDYWLFYMLRYFSHCGKRYIKAVNG